MIEAKIDGGKVECRCSGKLKGLAAELAGICQAVISGISDGNPEAGQRMKQMVCMYLLTDMAKVEIREGSEIIVIKGVKM